MCRGEQGLDVRGGLVDGTDEEKVPDTVTRSDEVMCVVRWSYLHVEPRAECRPLIAMCSESIRPQREVRSAKGPHLRREKPPTGLQTRGL